MKISSRIFSLGILGLISAPFAHAGLIDDLSVKDRAKIDNGEQVFFSKDVDNSSWPKVFVYQAMDCTPEEAAAVFFDYARGKDYIPDVEKSEISKTIDSVTHEVDYIYNVPAAEDETYTVRDQLSYYDGGQSYRISWVMVRASTNLDIQGDIRFERYGSGTLMSYTNYIKPGRTGASLFVLSAKKAVRTTAQAIARQIIKERMIQPEFLQKQIVRMRQALGR